MAVFLVLAVAGMAGVYYMGRSYLRKAGITSSDPVSSVLSSSSSSSGSIASALSGLRDGCDLLSKDEATAITGVTIEKTVGTRNGADLGCSYMAKPGENTQRGQNDIAKTFKELQSGKGTDAENLQEAEKMVKSFVNAAGSSVNNGAEIPVFSIGVTTKDGRTAFASLMMANKIMGSIAGATPAITGLGDEAFIGPMNSLMGVRKGDAVLSIDLRALPDGRDKGIAIAQKILGRI